MPTVGLFIPCYVDQFYPQVGMATLELLEQARRARRVSRGADLLRPADGEHRLHRRRPAAGRAVPAPLRRLRLRRRPVRAVAWRWCGITTTSCSATRPASTRCSARPSSCASSGRRAEGRPGRRPLPASRRPAPKLPRPARAAAGQQQRAPRARLQQVRGAARAAGRHRVRRARAARRVLRLRRHVRRQRGGRVVHDGADRIADHERGRRRGADRHRHVVPDAPGRAHPPRSTSRSA